MGTSSEIDDKQAIVTCFFSKKAQHKAFFSEDGTVDGSTLLLAPTEGPILFAKKNEIPVQLQSSLASRILISFGSVQPAPCKCFRIIGNRKLGNGFLQSQVGKLGHKVETSLAYELGEFRIVISKVDKRRTRTPFLTLKKHWRLRSQ